MGLLDMVKSMAGGGGAGEHAQVAGGLMEELQNQPGGVGGMLPVFSSERDGRPGAAMGGRTDDAGESGPGGARAWAGRALSTALRSGRGYLRGW